MKVPSKTRWFTRYRTRTYSFCSSQCLSEFQSSPTKYVPLHHRSPAFTRLPERICLSESAFVGLTLSVAETFKKEAMGYLLGRCIGKTIRVDHAIPFQTAQRGYVFTAISLRRLEWVRDIAQRIHLNVKWIGDYHSHSQRGKVLRLHLPSPLDVEDMELGYVYLLVSVNEVHTCIPWRNNKKKGTISGTLGNLRMEIAGYCLDKEEELRRLEVSALWLESKPE